jgi:hypothetical protein
MNPGEGYPNTADDVPGSTGERSEVHYAVDQTARAGSIVGL